MATINKRPSGKWQATVRYQGRSASKSFTKRADAVKWARESQTLAERGALVQYRGSALDKRTLGMALAEFRDTVAPTHRSGDREQRCIDAMLKHHKRFTRLRLDTLTVADVSNWRDERLQKVAPSTVVRELTLLQSAVSYALDAGVTNVVQQVKRPRVENRRERRLQAGEWQRLMQACDRDRNRLLRPILVLAAETAMRRGELLEMEWRHVNLQQSTVLLPRTKNGHPRTVPLSPVASQTLGELLRSNERVLPLSGDCVRQGFERLRKRAGVDDLRFHDLRHEAVSRFVERGLSLIEVQQISGHRTLQMLQRYVHLQAADIVEKLQDLP